MKKILYLLLLLLLGNNVALAKETIYSQYSDFGPYTIEYIEANELTDVKTEERYLWYKEEKVLGNYELYQGNKNVEDCYETEYTDWNTTYEEKIGRTYETRTVYNYEISNELRYIHLTNLYGSNGAFRIPELTIKIDGVEIPYNYICSGCMSGFENYINNGIYNENKSYIHNGGSLIIDLLNSYPTHKVELIFYIFDLGDEAKKYTISYSNDQTNIYATKDFIYEFSDEYWANSKLITHNITNLEIPKENWINNITQYNPLESDYIISTNIYNEYRYKETYCKNYTMNKIYNDTYTKDSIDDFNIKDETTKKTYYSFRTREKLELQDNLIINSYEYNLNDFVIYSSEEYKITDDINIKQNGIYNINFKTNNLNISKLVEVNILENIINTYQEEIKSLEQTINYLNKEKNELITNYEKQIEEKNSIIDNLKNELKQCKESCEELKECLQKEIKNKDILLEEYKTEIQKLKQEIISLTNKIKDLEIKDNENIEIITNLTNEKNKLENDINIKEETIKKLIEENKLQQEEINNLKLQNKNYQEQINTLEQINFEYNKKIEQLEYNIQKLNNEIKLLSDENIINIEEIKKINQLINIYKEQINTLKTEKINIEKYIDILKQNSESEINSLSETIKEITNLNNQYINDIKELEENINNLNKIINSLKIENDNNYNEYLKEIKSLKILNGEYLKKIKELENNLHNLNKSISDTINEKNVIIENYKNEIESLKQGTKQIENENINLNNKLNETTNENINLNDKLNNYVLKINNEEKIDLKWLYIFILILMLVYFLKKKSSKK